MINSQFSISKRQRKLRVAVGMSGGVDSSLTAAKLAEQGYEVTGVFLECWSASGRTGELSGCRADEDRKDALEVALSLKIPFKVLDFKKEYKKKVVDYFFDEFKAGRVPNPDTTCNKEIKFGMFYEWALKNNFEYVATGHYARIKKIREFSNPNVQFSIKSQFSNFKQTQNSKFKSRYQLLKGVDDKKDQSYFLYQLRAEQLAHILFPLGEMTKDQVRKEAKKRKLSTASKPDSQGICFIGEISIVQFLKDLGMKEKKGEVVVRKARSPKHEILNVSNLEVRDSSLEDEYEVVGQHRGVWFYTVGQRHGFEISNKLQVTSNKFKQELPPLYVIEKQVKNNRLVVGFGGETYRSQFTVKDLNWLTPLSGVDTKLRGVTPLSGVDTKLGGVTPLSGVDTKLSLVRIRHGGELIKSKIKMANDKATVELEEGQRGISPGQAAVFYSEDGVVLGGGVVA